MGDSVNLTPIIDDKKCESVNRTKQINCQICQNFGVLLVQMAIVDHLYILICA
jgi:flagellar biosynthesis component FlhA